jgi:hypothetical protein
MALRPLVAEKPLDPTANLLAARSAATRGDLKGGARQRREGARRRRPTRSLACS